MEYIILILLLVSIILNAAILLKKSGSDRSKTDMSLNNIDKKQDRLESAVREEFARNRQEVNSNISGIRDVLSLSARQQNESIVSTLSKISEVQKHQLDSFSNQLYQLTNINSEKLDKINDNVEKKLLSLQESNVKKLDEMRQVVDEKLHATLEKRLGESFNLVAERLENVYKSLSEVQNLTSGVNDLKKIFDNVKNRGSWGEMQLSMILDEFFTKEQYEENVATKKNTKERVEFAIKLPNKESDKGFLYLPMDSKFPIEDYHRLMEAQENGDVKACEAAIKQLQDRIKASAKDIRDKYINPPTTTDYAIMFLPTESLYAEVLRIPGLFERVHKDYRIIITGPTTITAILNSIQMGFRTLAIEKHSQEVWKLLSVVKTEFKNFGTLLQKTHDKLQEASSSIEKATDRTRIIDKKLKNVEELQYDDPAFLMIEDEIASSKE